MSNMCGRLGRRAGWAALIAGLLGAGCEQGAPSLDKVDKPAQSATTDRKPESPGSGSPSLDTEQLRRVVEQWRAAQDDGNMTQYGKLYALDFTGVKRVGDQAIPMGREQWLKDRQSLALKTPRVEVSDLRFHRHKEGVIAEFHQRWVTKDFADEGTKALTLRKQGSSWQIVRETMLTSAVMSKEERARAPKVSGHCASLGEALEERERAGELWRFADLGGSVGPSRWARVSSWEEAEKKTPDQSVWLSATVVSDGKWLLAFTSFFSPSGDSAVLTEQCYRPNGRLARLHDAFRTFNTGRGLGEDVRVTVFDEQGNAGWRTRQTYLLETGERLNPNEMMGEADSAPSKLVLKLPYFALLPPEVRQRY